jgi:hypothetical protein
MAGGIVLAIFGVWLMCQLFRGGLVGILSGSS